jgi:hypothetical protein
MDEANGGIGWFEEEAAGHAGVRFLPKFLGVLLILDGFAVALWFLQGMLLPDNPALSTPGLALSFIAEAGLGLWLLLKGISDEEGAPSPADEFSADARVS